MHGGRRGRGGGAGVAMVGLDSATHHGKGGSRRFQTP